jgi:gliding motility-associated-like protein
MNNYLRHSVLIVFFLHAFCVNAQIDEVFIQYQADDLSTFAGTFSSHYASGALRAPFDAQDSLVYIFDWQFGDGKTGSKPVMIHHYTSAGIYDVILTVTLRGDPSLVYSAVFSVTVTASFEVPNVFTPDGDGYNDNFIVRSNGVTPLEITIFDRSGSIVYRHTSPVINWDGRTPAGIRVRPGVYYYVISSSEPLYNRNGFFHVFYND